MNKITIDRAVVERALERLQKYHHGNGFVEDAECITALLDALARHALRAHEQVSSVWEYARRCGA